MEDTRTQLEKVADVAKEAMAKIQADKAARLAGNLDKDKGGKQGTAPVGDPPPKTKTKEELEAEAVSNQEKEAQAEKDRIEAESKKAEALETENNRILEAKDVDLNDEDKTKKQGLVEAKRKKQAQEALDKRFGELTGQIKDLKADKTADQAKSQTKIADLEKELSDIREKVTPPDTSIKDLLKKAKVDRIAKYTEEDKDKPKEERRAISNEELGEWLVEEPVEAQKWVTKNTIFIQKEDDFIEDQVTFKIKQTESSSKMLGKHPEFKAAIEKKKALLTEGKTEEEAEKLVRGEFEKYRILGDLVKEDPKKYLNQANSPELAGEEMEKRLEKTPPDGKQFYSQDDIDKIAADAVKKSNEVRLAEEQRQADLDEGLTGKKPPVKTGSGKQSDFEKEQERIAGLAGITPEQLKKIKERRKKIPGATG